MTEKVKDAGLGESPVMPRLQEGASEVVSIRHLSPAGELLGVVNCVPGYLTVVQEGSGNSPSDSAFRAALLQRRAEIDIRSGQDTLHPSEVHVVQVTDRVLNARNVVDALLEGGAPKQDIPRILQQIGLESAQNLQPKELGVSALKRLTIAISVYAKARLLLFDRPFMGSDPAWVEKIAQLLLSVGEIQARVMIVTGEAKIPAAWRNHPRVMLHNSATLPERSGFAGGSFSVHAQTSEAVAAHTAAQANLNLQPRPGEVVTRPQLIHSSNRPGPHESLQAEAIPNPRAEAKAAEALRRVSGLAQLTLEGVQETRRDTVEENPQNEYRRQRKNTGKLTQVNTADRLKRTRIAEAVGLTVKKLTGRVAARPLGTDLPRAARLLNEQRRSDARLYTVLLIGVILVACSIIWFGK